MSRDVFEPGDMCGAHEIVKRIAEGGHGQVYLARHNEGGFRAIKTLHAQFLDIPNVRQRFDNEILLLSAIDSVHVVRVFEYGLASGHPWFAMEFLDGQPLRRAVLDAGGRLEIERAFRFGRQLARGVHAAHQLKAIHRDLKPENIIVMPGDVLKILDFGIAKIRGWAVATTGRGEGFCTPLYAAPEQIDGSGRRADARTDVYAIGVILWEMLVGKNPFLDEDGNQPAMEITLGVKMTRPLRRLPEMVRGFPEDLSEIIERSTAIDPDARYASAAELAAAIKEPLKRWVARTRGDALPEMPKEMAALTAAVRTGEPAPRSVPAVVPVAAEVQPPASAVVPRANVERAAPPAAGTSPMTTGWARTEPLSEAFHSSWLPPDLAAAGPVDPANRAPPTRVGGAVAAAPKATERLPAGTSAERFGARPPARPSATSSDRVSTMPPAVASGPRTTLVDAVRVKLRERTILAAVIGSLFGAAVCVAVAVPLLRAQNAAPPAIAVPLDAEAGDAPEVPAAVGPEAGAGRADVAPVAEQDAGLDGGDPTQAPAVAKPSPAGAQPSFAGAQPLPAVAKSSSVAPSASPATPKSSAAAPISAPTTPKPSSTASKTPPKKKSDRPVLLF